MHVYIYIYIYTYPSRDEATGIASRRRGRHWKTSSQGTSYVCRFGGFGYVNNLKRKWKHIICPFVAPISKKVASMIRADLGRGSGKALQAHGKALWKALEILGGRRLQVV